MILTYARYRSLIIKDFALFVNYHAGDALEKRAQTWTNVRDSHPKCPTQGHI